MKTNIADLKIGCPCGGSTKKIETTWHGITVRAWKCKKCNEEIFHPLDAQKAMEIVKARENHALSVKVREVGKSLTITVPQSITELFNIHKGGVADWDVSSVNENRFVVEMHNKSK